MDYNKVILVGRTTKKPERKSTTNGMSLTVFSLATSYKYTDNSGNKQEQTEFHNIVFFGKLAEVIEKYVEKGQVILVEGRLSTSKWEKDGNTFQQTKVIGESFQFGEKAKNSSGSNEQKSSPEEESISNIL